MKSYFLSELSRDALIKLQTAAIPVCEFGLDDEGVGFMFGESDLAQALRALNAEVASEEPTSYEGIVRATLRPRSAEAAPAAPTPKPAATVTVASWEGKNQSGFKKAIEEILLPVLGWDIILDVPHKSHCAPAQDGCFHIHIWSSPSGGNDQKIPRTMWGVGVSCRDDGFAPSGMGQAIVDNANWPVAELLGNEDVGWDLYIHHDICHHGSDEETAIFRCLLEEVVVELSATPEEKAERLRCQAEERRVQSRAAYTKECSARFEKTVAGTKKAIIDGEAEVARLQQALIKKIREVQGAERKLKQLESCRGGELEKYGQEFDKLLAVPKVRDVQVADGVVKVFTDTLYCVDPRSGKRHEIGAFRIEILTTGANGGVRWYNLTRRVDGYKNGQMAPHIWSEGSACLGTTAEIFPELIGNYEFAAAAMVAIQFAESVNTDDAAGKYIVRWPVVE